MKHAEEFRFCVIDIILQKFIRLLVTIVYSNLCTPMKNGSYLTDLRKVDPYSFCNRERHAFVITNSFGIMKFSTDTVYTILLWMKIIKTGFKTDYQEEQQTRGNTDGESECVDESIAFISFQISESGFEIIPKHKR